MTRPTLLAACAALGLASAGAAPADDVSNLVRALWLVQGHGTPEAADPRNDQMVKGKLAKALGKEGTLTAAGAQGLIGPTTFARLAGPDARLDPAEIKRVLETDAPESREHLLPKVAAHAAYLTTTFDLIDEPHRRAGATLAEWIAANYKPGQPLHVTVVCTGNSRRSILGSTMGNIAADYYGMPEVRFHSGGTAPTAFNPRTATALKAIGVEVEPTGVEAPRGEPDTANPVYRVRWGDAGEAMVATEFSKKYNDPSNPQKGFAALMVCSEADASCPAVVGAAKRVSMPYLDPKLFDGSDEAAKYAERRDDMGRLMLAVLMQARHRVARPSAE